jgi:acetyltransferase-like isoleucine patch superfamily enzyme
LWLYRLAFVVPHYLWRILVCEPVFKARCKVVGRGVRTDIYLHSIQGQGEIVLGDGVLMDGKCFIHFAARFCERPQLSIGSGTGIGHRCSFVIGKRIAIGKDCRIASEVMMFDSPGHPLDPASRRAGSPPADADVKPIVIEDNVWIGRRAILFPGVTLGVGSVVATGSLVTGDVPPYTLVAGNPARRVMTLSTPDSAPVGEARASDRTPVGSSA